MYAKLKPVRCSHRCWRPHRAHRSRTQTLPDPDLIRLFMEEAREELAKIEQHYPVWEQNPLESESLLIVRRSFHRSRAAGAWSTLAISVNLHGRSRICSIAWWMALCRARRRCWRRCAVRWMYCRSWSPSWIRVTSDAPTWAHSPPERTRWPEAAAVRSRLQRRRPQPASPMRRSTPRQHPHTVSRTSRSSWSTVPQCHRARTRQLRRFPSTSRMRKHSLEIDNVNLDALLDPVKIPEDLVEPPDDALRDIYARETASHVATVRAGSRANGSTVHRTCCRKRSIGPATRWSAARPWPRRATAFGWPSR